MAVLKVAEELRPQEKDGRDHDSHQNARDHPVSLTTPTSDSHNEKMTPRLDP